MGYNLGANDKKKGVRRMRLLPTNQLLKSFGLYKKRCWVSQHLLAHIGKYIFPLKDKLGFRLRLTTWRRRKPSFSKH